LSARSAKEEGRWENRMTKKTLEGKTTLRCDLDNKNRTYNCEMPKLKQKKKAKGPITGEWVIPEIDMHKWNTQAIRISSNVKITPSTGFLSRAGGTFGGVFPSSTYLECKTGLKMGKFSLTDCTLKREEEF